jgi:AcrR family transcriptional regulator
VTSATPIATGPSPAGSARRRLPREARARQLLDVAEAVFAERGVQSSSMDDIAERAGVTKPILYDHYGSKDRLVAAVIMRAGSILAEAVLAAVNSSSSPEDALVRGLRAYFEFIELRRSGLHSLLTEGVVPGSEAAAALEAVRNQQAEMIAALLLEQAVEPVVDQAKIYAQIVIGATERLATRPGVDATPSVDALTRHVMDVIWCGFGTLRDGTRWEPADPA